MLVPVVVCSVFAYRCNISFFMTFSMMLSSVSRNSTRCLHNNNSVIKTTAKTIGRIFEYHNPAVSSVATSSIIERFYNTTPICLFKHTNHNNNKANTNKKAKGGAKDAINEELIIDYMKQKQLNKERRTELYNYKQDRKARLMTRRKTTETSQHMNSYKDEFNSFYIPYKVNHEYMERKAKQLNLNWFIKVAVLLERPNIVIADLYDWENNYELLRDYIWQYNHIKDYPIGLNLGYRPEVTTSSIPDATTTSMMYPNDEMIKQMLPDHFKPALRTTDDDISGNIHTTNRKLKTNVYLMTQNTNNNIWEFPTVSLQDNGDNETLLDASKRTMKEYFNNNDNLEYWCPSNCPVSVHMDAFSENDKELYPNYYGTKTFYMKLQYDDGQVDNNTCNKILMNDYGWFDKEECLERIQQNQQQVNDDKQKDEISQKDCTLSFYKYLL